VLNCPVICTLLIIEHKGHVSPENCQVFQEGSGTVDSKIQHNIPVTVLSYQRLVSISLGALGTSSTQMLKLLSPYMCVCMSICVCVCVCVCGREGGGRLRERTRITERIQRNLVFGEQKFVWPIRILIKSKQTDGQFTGISARVAERITSLTLHPIEDMFWHRNYKLKQNMQQATDDSMLLYRKQWRFERRVKSHLSSAGIIRSSPYSPR